MSASNDSPDDQPSAVGRFLDNISFIAHQTKRLFYVNLPDFSLDTIRGFIFARSWAERKAFITTLFTSDPYTLQRLVHGVEGKYSISEDGMLIIMRDFDEFVRVATSVRCRGDMVCEYFNRISNGSSFTGEPRMYNHCPYGVWEERNEVEPHVLCREMYQKQIPDIGRIIDEGMAEYVGKVVEVGTFMRGILWDLIIFTCYGVNKNEDSRKMLKVFEDLCPELDYGLRIGGSKLPNEWTPKMTALINQLSIWSNKVAEQRQVDISKGDIAEGVDILTHMLLTYPDMAMTDVEGAIRGVFTASVNNLHGAISGMVVQCAQQKDAVYRYWAEDPDTRNEHVARESLRLFTAIPVTREVKEEDTCELDGKRLKAGATVVLATFAVQTDPRVWDKPQEFMPQRWVGRKDRAFMCQPGFLPFGAAAELGGRQCGGRFYSWHMQCSMVAKLLRDYKFTEVGRGFFDFRNSAGTSMYAGKCRVRVEKRA